MDVQNVGRYEGDEVIQLYLRDCFASMTRPVKELAGFKREHFKSGEKKTVEFTLKVSQTAFLDRKMKWKVEKGDVEVQVGSSSEDIRLSDNFTIMENAWIAGKERGFYAAAKVK